MKIKLSSIIFILFFSIINLIFILSFASNNKYVNISFILNFIVIYIGLAKVFFLKKNFLETTFWTFNYLFLFIAPYIQTYSGIYPNTMPINENLIIKCNVIVFLFMSVYIIFNIIFKAYFIRRKKIYDKAILNLNIIGKNTYYIIFILNMFVLLFFLKKNGISLSDRGINMFEENNGLVVYLIVTKVILNLPVFSVIYLIFNKSAFRKQEYILNCFITALNLILIHNPIIMARNQFGVIYLSIIILFFYKKISNLILFTLYLIAFILFPYIGIITHSDNIFEGLSKNRGLIEALNHLDFDAWSNIMASIQYVDIYGNVQYSEFFGGLFFFIPRSIWPNKPQGSGVLIGDFLMENYRMWFNNLSNPFLSEGYLNGGIFGLIIFAILIVFIFNYLEAIKNKYIELYAIISAYMLFFLRGSFLSAFAYLIGFIIAIFIFPAVINKLTKKVKFIGVFS